MDVGLILLGLAILIVGSNLLVDNAIALARILGVSEALIGLTIVAAELKGVTKSEYLRSALMQRLEEDLRAKSSPWELGKAVFGKYDGGDPNRSTNRKVLLKEKLRAKTSGH